MARIVVLTGSFPCHRSDAAGAHIGMWARALAGRGHDLLVCAPESAAANGTDPVGVRVVRVGPKAPLLSGHLWYGAGAPTNLRHSWRAWLETPLSLSAFARAGYREAARADLVWSHWSVPFGVVGTLVAGLRRLPHVVQIHGSDLGMLESMPAGGMLLSAVVRRSACCLCVSEEQCVRAERLCGSRARLRVLPMGVEPPPEGARSRCEPPQVLVLSRLVASKGVDLVIRAMAELGARARLVVVGDGPERAAWTRLAADLRIDAHFAGPCSPAERWQHLATADLFVHAARGIGHAPEGCPVTIGEAQAAGVPVVATRVGGVIDAVGEAGLLVPPDDAGALALAISRVLDDPGLASALRDRGRAQVQERLWPRLVSSYDEVVAEVVARR